MVRSFLVIAAMTLGAFAALPAHAATAFFYSESDSYYGWAAGYAYSRSESEAQSECTKAGGADCRFAIECNDGWSAIAFPDESAKGVGIACGFSSAEYARIVAMASCMNAVRAMCWTESAFDANARAIAREANERFDQTYLAQQMLYYLGFMGEDDQADGKYGPRTRAGVTDFQHKLGVAENGEVSFELILRLLNAVGGPQVLARGLYGAEVEPSLDEIKSRIYTAASQPQPERSYSEELATYVDEQKRLGLATIMIVNDHPCKLPARSADPVPADGTGGWHVQCDGGDYTLVLHEGYLPYVGTGLRPVTVASDGTVTVGGASDVAAEGEGTASGTDHGGSGKLDKL